MPVVRKEVVLPEEVPVLLPIRLTPSGLCKRHCF